MRLAAVSTALTFVILCGFATVIGQLTVSRIRSDFYRQVAAEASTLRDQLLVELVAPGKISTSPSLAEVAATSHAAIRILGEDGVSVIAQTAHAPYLGPPVSETNTVNGYRVANYTGSAVLPNGRSLGTIYVQYAKRISDVEATVARVRLLLVLGVLAGSGLALLGGLMVARRAMAPIARLTTTAAEIERTRDPSRRVPQPESDDEVAELARTLDGMLRSLDSARAETEAALAQQRRFVADASHELRTPLTSVLANLELLADSLHGEQGEAAHSALRSSRRMRRLVADLLLLARSDVGRVVAPRAPTDLAQVAIEAAAELGPVSEGHEITVDARPAVVEGVRDELHRLAVNLLENALRHTPPGTDIRVSTGPAAGGPNGDGSRAPAGVELVVEDDGPGVPPELAPRLFERFVRGAGDRGGSFGLGLAIVRAVAESHGGRVALQVPAGGRGARFEVWLPAAAKGARAAEPAQAARG